MYVCVCVCVSGCIFPYILLYNMHTYHGAECAGFSVPHADYGAVHAIFLCPVRVHLFFFALQFFRHLSPSRTETVCESKRNGKQSGTINIFTIAKKKHTPKREQSRQTNMSACRERTSGLGYNILIDNNLREATRAPRCVDGKAPGLVVVVAAFADNITTMTLADN